MLALEMTRMLGWKIWGIYRGLSFEKGQFCTKEYVSYERWIKYGNCPGAPKPGGESDQIPLILLQI